MTSKERIYSQKNFIKVCECHEMQDIDIPSQISYNFYVQTFTSCNALPHFIVNGGFFYVYTFQLAFSSPFFVAQLFLFPPVEPEFYFHA